MFTSCTPLLLTWAAAVSCGPKKNHKVKAISARPPTVTMISAVSIIITPFLFLDFESTQTQGVGYHAHRRERHSARCNDGAEEPSGEGIENSRCDGNAEHVVDEGKKQVLLDV